MYKKVAYYLRIISLVLFIVFICLLLEIIFNCGVFGISFLIMCSLFVLINIGLYLEWTGVAEPIIAGVQGRYFIPLMFPLYLALSGAGAFVPEYPKGDLDRVRSEAEPAGGRLESVPAVCYYLLEIAELTVLALTVWTAVICAFSL